jgi:hypothetical protein
MIEIEHAILSSKAEVLQTSSIKIKKFYADFPSFTSD